MIARVCFITQLVILELCRSRRSRTACDTLSMNSWISSLAPDLAQRQQDNLYRQRLTLQSAQGPVIRLDGRDYLNFSSNDYLGLANEPAVVAAFVATANQYGVGSGASHLVVGHHAEHHKLELALADFTGRDRALLFSSGYMANLGVLKALLGKGDLIIEDKLNHASLIDGGLASGANLLRYKHNDIAHLNQQLDKQQHQYDGRRKILAVDGVFSMDGDTAPLISLADICQQHDIALMVDDAHGLGVLGESGGGCSDLFKLDQNRLPILMGTLGKAFGVAGAFVAGSHDLIESLIQYARTYIYTTALPPACASAGLAALKVIQQQPERRKHLNELIHYFRAGMAARGFVLPLSDTAIQPLIIGDSKRAMEISKALYAKGFLLSAIRPPTVAAGSARLRITLTAAHSFQQLDQLLDALAESAADFIATDSTLSIRSL